MTLTDNRTIHLLWPTVRPGIMLDTFKYWVQTADDPSKIKTNVAVNTLDQAKRLIKYQKLHEIIIVGNGVRGVAAPSFALSYWLKAKEDDIIILASDDFYPPLNWDILVKQKFNEYGDGCLVVNDGIQRRHCELLCTSCGNSFQSILEDLTKGCITIPIMTYNCLLQLKRIIYHPDYGHLWSDAELYINLKELGILIGATDLFFEHRHWGNQKRIIDKADKLAYGNVKKSRLIFHTRIKSGDYDLNARLKINHKWISYAKNVTKVK
jgi:hypothetical protein